MPELKGRKGRKGTKGTAVVVSCVPEVPCAPFQATTTLGRDGGDDSRVSPDNRGTSTTTATQVNTLDVEPKVK